MEILKIGDTITYEQWSGNVVSAKIEKIELCHREHEKEGVEIEEVSTDEMYRCCLSLEDGGWCYGCQVLDIE